MIEYNDTHANMIPTITEHPASQSVTEGQSAIFKVCAIGASPLHYQWFENEIARGADSDSHVVLGSKSLINTQIFVKISNSFGAAISEKATLSLTALPLDPFDPMNLGISTDYAAAISAQAAAKPFELRKPNDQEFFRTSPRDDHHLVVASITDKQEMGRVYIVRGDFLEALKAKFPRAARASELVLAQSLAGAAFVWPIPLAEDRGGKWNSSQRQAGDQSKTRWTNMAAGRGQYDLITAKCKWERIDRKSCRVR
jgi:hypothetical protein